MPDMPTTQGAESETPGNTVLTAPPAQTPAPNTTPENSPTPTAPGQTPPAPPATPAPEPYELTAPDGYPMSAGNVQKLNAMCKKAKLTKEQGEAVLKYLHGNYTAWQEGQAAQLKSWEQQARTDKEFGGTNFDANVADARKALSTFDTDGSIRAMLEDTGYGSHPAVLKIFARVGKALGEDKLTGQGGNGTEEKPLEDRLWPNMN
ncbi:MAG: hypothetical protein IJU37_00705 [Desulfovibrio sp.]|nr:hypothetical protein [Desulfovibrio sp.]